MNGKKWDVYVYGDVNIDIVIPGVKKFPEPGQEDEVDTMETFVGGGAALFTLGVGKLGLHTVFQGEVGDDWYGKMIRKKFRDIYVDDSLLKISKTQKTGISLSFTNEKDRSFLTYRGTNDKITMDAVDVEQVKQASHIHVTGYTGSANHDSYLRLLKRVKEETQATVSFDVGWDSTGEWKSEIYELFPYIDVLFMNETECIHYSRKETAEEAARDFAEYCSLVVIKMGKKGSFAVSGKEFYREASYKVEAVDTTGAGDSFNAGFVYGFLHGRSIQECLRYGNGCGALSVTALGGNTGFPLEEELIQFIGEKRKRKIIKLEDGSMKIAVIGGAGVRTVIFINGLLARYKKLNIDEVVLYDIQEEKQRIIEKLCKHVVERKQEKLKVWAVSDPVKAVTGADYIVTTLRVGGDHSRVVDETIALDMGVIGQETTGVGGFSMAVRTIPVLMEYCEMIQKYAPNAWIFNFTNPSGLVTQALRSAGYDRIIGICDAPSSTKFRMARDLGVTEDELYVEFFGLNHLSWIRSVKKKGEEILPELLKDDSFLQGVQEFSMFDPELLRSIGFLPNEYLYYYYHREKALENIRKSGGTRGKTIESVNLKMMEELKEMDIDANPEGALQIFLYYMQIRENSYMSIESGLAKRPLLEKGQLEVPDGMGYAGVMLDCIEGMQSEEGKYLVLSVENHGSIPGLEDDDVVETTCLVSKAGIQPIRIENVPEHCYLLMRIIKMYEKLTVEAVKNHSKDTAVRALMLHPLVNSYSLAKNLVEKYDEVYGGIFQ